MAGVARPAAGGGGFRSTLVLVFLATAPDLDLALRLLDGANHHRGPSHSLGAALLAGVGVLALRRLGVSRLPGAIAAAAAWGSHVVLDYFGLDTTPPIGLMALWPWSGGFFASPVSIFYDVPRSFSLRAMRHNALAVFIEALVLLPLVWLAWGRPRSFQGAAAKLRGVR